MAQRDGIVTDLRVEETLNLTVGGTVKVAVPDSAGLVTVSITLEAKSGQVARLRVKTSSRAAYQRISKAGVVPVG